MGSNLKQFRTVMGRFCTGVTIITFKSHRNFYGFTVNSFTSVSLDPPLILICKKNNLNGNQFLDQKDCFVVNILSEE